MVSACARRLGSALLPIVCLLLSLVAPLGVFAGIPQQPPNFATKLNEVGVPMALWTFRQAQCISGTIPEDRSVGPSFIRNETTASCPVVGSFQNAVIGATSNLTTETNTIKTGSISNTFVDVTTPLSTPPYRSLSLAMWFTPTSTIPPRTSVLLEVGGDGAGLNQINPAEIQLRLSFESSATVANNRIRAEVLVNDGSTDSEELLICLNGAPVQALAASVDTNYFLGVSIFYDSSLRIRTYLRPAGGSASSCTGDTGPTPHSFVLPTTSVIRLGSSRAIGGSIFGFPATYHLVSFFNKTLAVSDFDKLFDAGLPNSVPAVRTGSGQNFTLNEDQSNPRINVASISVSDYDNNPLTAIKIKSLPTVGQLLNNGVAVSVNSTVFAADNLTYISPRDAFSNADPTCSQFISNPNNFRFASFEIEATDGLGDGSVVCNNSPLDESCVSPRRGNVTICVREVNDPPIVNLPASNFIAFAGLNNTAAFQVSCRDIDLDTASYGLSKIRIINQSQPSLGRINTNGSNCQGVFVNLTSPAATEFTVNPAQNESSVITYCYDAYASNSTQALLGNDTITFVCEDKAGAVTTGTVVVSVFNGLLAGCGVTKEQVANRTPCPSTVIEDVAANLTLKGNDSVAGHILANRVYRLDSIPTALQGNLTLPGSIDSLAVGSVLRADANGELLLTYRPTKDYFNAMCELNKDPVSTVCANPRFTDGLNVPITPQSGPFAFQFSLGYNESGTVAFGPPASYLVTVLGVNDPPTSFVGPIEISMPVTSKDYYLSDQSPPNFTYSDPDKDTMRIAFKIETLNAQFFARFTGLNLSTNPINPRFNLIQGDECLENGRTGCKFIGKAYVSDFHAFLSKLSVIQTRGQGNTSLVITVWDPALQADNFLDLAFDSSLPGTINASSLLQARTNSTALPSDNALTVALWAGIGAGFLFIFLACLACWGTLIIRAKRGEETAVWLVKNVLCTDVEHKAHPDLHKMAAGGRRSLENAVRADVTRMNRILCCALFARRVCPCCIKFDPSNVKLPEVDDLLEIALTEEKNKLANKHKPKDPPTAAPPRPALAEDEEEVEKEDPLANDDIFDWERHKDEKTGKVFYYNVKTKESRWTPPTVKVLERRKSIDRMVAHAPYSPHPPAEPKAASSFNFSDDPEADRVKKT